MNTKGQGNMIYNGLPRKENPPVKSAFGMAAGEYYFRLTMGLPMNSRPARAVAPAPAK